MDVFLKNKMVPGIEICSKGDNMPTLHTSHLHWFKQYIQKMIHRVGKS